MVWEAICALGCNAILGVYALYFFRKREREPLTKPRCRHEMVELPVTSDQAARMEELGLLEYFRQHDFVCTKCQAVDLALERCILEYERKRDVARATYERACLAVQQTAQHVERQRMLLRTQIRNPPTALPGALSTPAVEGQLALASGPEGQLALISVDNEKR